MVMACYGRIGPVIQQVNPSPQPGPAWKAAEEYGVDMSLIEDSLAKTPLERIRANNAALKAILALRKAMERHHARS